MIVSNKELEVRKLGERFSTVEAIAIENRPRSWRGASPLLWAMESHIQSLLAQALGIGMPINSFK